MSIFNPKPLDEDTAYQDHVDKQLLAHEPFCPDWLKWQQKYLPKDTNMTTEDLAQKRMALAEATTDASRSLDRTKRKIEAVLEALGRLQMIDSANIKLDDNIQRCRLALSQLTAINSDVRGMNS